MTATTEPGRVTAGDTIAWTKTLADYPATASWVLSYTLINATSKITITATAGGPSGADHVVNVPAATSAAWAAGTYAWQGVVTKGAERFTVGTGSMAIAANWAAAATLDTRSHAIKVLAAIEAYLESPANTAAASYEIAGRKLQRHSMTELLTLRDRYRAEAAREANAARLAAGLASKNQIYTRFTSR
jgi:hypothetical protein